MQHPIPPEILRELIHYEPETGKLFWLPRRPEFVGAGRNGSEIEAQRFNARYAGSEALNSPTRNGYLAGAIFARSTFSHRAAWALHYGQWPAGMIDHINGVRTDNRIANLRVVGPSGNAKNAARRKDNPSGRTGVYWHDGRKKWVAIIRGAGRTKGLGNYKNFADASAARDRAEREYGFHPNHGRAV